MDNFLQTNQHSATIATPAKPGQWPTYSRDTEEPLRRKDSEKERWQDARRTNAAAEDDAAGKDARDEVLTQVGGGGNQGRSRWMRRI
jgi:hypothetical protein